MGFLAESLYGRSFNAGTDIRELGLSKAVCVVHVEEGQSLADGLDSAMCLLREEGGDMSIQLQLCSSQLKMAESNVALDRAAPQGSE